MEGPPQISTHAAPTLLSFVADLLWPHSFSSFSPKVEIHTQDESQFHAQNIYIVKYILVYIVSQGTERVVTFLPGKYTTHKSTRVSCFLECLFQDVWVHSVCMLMTMVVKQVQWCDFCVKALHKRLLRREHLNASRRGCNQTDSSQVCWKLYDSESILSKIFNKTKKMNHQLIDISNHHSKSSRRCLDGIFINGIHFTLKPRDMWLNQLCIPVDTFHYIAI